MKFLRLILALGAITAACCAQQTLSGTMTVTGASGSVQFNVSGIVVTPADYYVAPISGPVVAPCVNGSNANTGTDINHPFATLDKARSVVQSRLGTKPFTIMLCGGTYYGSSTTFQGIDSGTVANPVTYTNYTGQTPILSGGTNVGGGGWTTSTTGTCAQANANGFTCYLTAISNSSPFFEQLYYQPSGGTMGRRMRPRMGATASNLVGVYGLSNNYTNNKGPIHGSATCGSANAVCGTVYTTGDPVSAWTSCTTGTDCEIYSLAKWTGDIGRIKSITTGSDCSVAGNCTILTTCSGSNCDSTSAGTGGPFQLNMLYVIENVKELLAFGGQWYLDRSASNPNNPNWTLYYVAKTGENPNSDVVVIPNNTQVLTLNALNNVTFSGLTFQNDNFTIPSTGYVSTQLDHNLTQALATCAACVNMTFSGNTFQLTGSSGLRVTGSSTSMSISGNYFFDVGGYGVQLGVFAPQGGSTDAANPNSISLTQNWVEGTSRFLPSADCVMVGLANHLSLTSNDLGYCYDKGFEICQPSNHTCSNGSSTDHDITISNNDIHNIGQGVMTDLAAFYASTETGTNNVFSNNRAHDVNGAVVQNASVPDPGVHGLYLDDQTGLWTIKNNVVYRALANLMHMNAGPQAASQANTIQNNIFVNFGKLPSVSGGCVGIQQPNTSVKSFIYENNICYQDLSSHVLANQGQGPPSTNSTAQQQFISDVYFNNAGGTFVFTGATPNIAFSKWQSTYGEDTAGSITTNPGFVNATTCTPSNDPFWPYPDPGTCDDFRFSNGTGPGFGFVYTAESYGPTNRITLPSIPATFPEAILAPSSW